MKERAIFDGALALEDPAERSAYLDRECGRNSMLRRRVVALLDALPKLDSFLESPLRPNGEFAEWAAKPGDVIGNYKLLQMVGEGGFGIVYMAEQQRPVRRKVALKIIKAGMDSREIIGRFEAERQALAMMDHPNIARVLDAGTTETGRPYFAMDLVRGSPITEFCDDHQLTLSERLKLFVPVCRAIQHAHQKGIIHRDIKPSNILITSSDGGPTPKVIDFGIAKAIDQRLTERTMFTRFGQVVGTLEYMSPEQAEMGGLDIDTRSDVYSLGVVLYELLTGSTPLERARLQGAAFDEILRMIREEEPETPSDRLSQSGDDLVAISAQRRIEPKKIGAFMRRELDWVVMKALEKSRSRRFATANEFADDIEHFLRGEPVTACPPSLTYRLGKFARKHLAMIVGTSLLLAVLLVTTPISTWQAIRATQAQHIAASERDQARQARDEARKSRDAESQARLALLNAYQQLSAEQVKTTEAHQLALRNEARLAAEKGYSLIQQGKTREAMLWLIRALNHMPAEEEVSGKFIQLNIASIWHEIPQPSVAAFELANVDGIANVMDADPDGRFVSLVSDPNKQLHVWASRPDGKNPSESQIKLQDGPKSLAFLSDECLLSVTATALDRWNFVTGQPEKRMDHGAAIGRVYVHPKASRVFVIDQNNLRAQLIDATSGQVIGTVTASEGRFLWPPSGGYGPFSPEGDALGIAEVPYARQSEQQDLPSATAILHRLAVSGTPLGDPIRLAIPGDSLPTLRYTVGHRAESILIAVSENRTGQTIVRHMDAVTGQSMDFSIGNTTGVRSLAIAPNGLVLATGIAQASRGTTQVDLWSLAPQRQVIGEITTTADVEKVRFDRDGHYVYTLGRVPMVRWTVPQSRLCSQLLPHDSAIQALTMSRDGQTVLTISGRQASRWDFSKGELISAPLPLPSPSRDDRVVAAFSPDGNTLLVADGAMLYRWDTGTGQSAGPPISVAYDIARLAVDGSGRRAICICFADDTKPEIHVFDLATGEQIGRPIQFMGAREWGPHQPGFFNGVVALSPDGNMVVASDMMGRLRVNELTTGVRRKDAMEFRGMLTDVRFDPSGHFVLASVNQQTLELRDGSSGERVGQAIHLDRQILAHTLSPDGQVLATAVDGQIQLWFLATGQPLGKPIVQSNVTTLCFSPDGDMLLAGDVQGLVRTWRVFHQMEVESLTVANVEAITGMQLTENGTVANLDSAAWRQRFEEWKILRDGQVESTTSALPRTIEAALAAQTPDEWRILRAGLEREVERPSGWLARLLSARAKRNAEQADQALVDVKEAIQFGPPQEVKNWLKYFARNEHRQRQRERAHWYLDQLVQAELVDAEVFLMLAELNIAENRRAEAVDWLQQAMDAQPTSTAVLRSVGEIEIQLNRWETAAHRFTRALELGGGNAEVWKLRAACFAELGRWDEAAEDLGKAVQRHPRINDLREQLAIALVSAKNMTGYRELCAETLANFDLVDYAKRPWTVPGHLALAPDGLANYDAIIKPAQNFADEHADGCVSPHILVPFCFRSGEYDRAAGAKFPANSNVLVQPDVMIFFAMAQAKTGNIAESKRKLGEVEVSGWQRFNIWEKQRIRLLLAEAEQVLSAQIK